MKILRIAATFGVIFVCGITIRKICFEPLRCNRIEKRITVVTRTLATMAPARAAPLARRNLEILAPCAADVRSSSIRMLIGANRYYAGNIAGSEDAYVSALRIGARPEILFTLGMVQLEDGRLDEASDNLATAAVFYIGYALELDDAAMRAEIMALAQNNQFVEKVIRRWKRVRH